MPNTPEQEKAIKDRGHDLLVSAPAGSGKTKVLVNRIVSLITDPEEPVDIDRLLVVTFTRAAAAEMRERVIRELDQLSGDTRQRLETEKNSGERERLHRLSELLERQQALIHNAQITTIDSFCLFVVRDHFQDISLDPGFRIAEEGELLLLEEEVLDEVFEAWYGRAGDEERDRFLKLVNAYSGKRNDRNVREMAARLYRQSRSNPWPKRWLKSLESGCAPEASGEESAPERMMRTLAERAGRLIRDERERLSALRDQAMSVPGLEKYGTVLAGDIEKLGSLPEGADYGELFAFFRAFKLGPLAAIRGFEGDAGQKEAVKDGRNQVKKELEDLKNHYFCLSPEQVREQGREQADTVSVLVELALDYTAAMEKAKAGRHIVDFSDIEHFALEILVDEKTGELRPAALELRERLLAVMIDEYQDSNLVQETIMKAITGEDSRRLFMVGDVKQSIYRFRLARPELFMEKYNRYSQAEDAPQKRIILGQNFRSRGEVLAITNDIFEKIMQEDLGDIAYDDEARLHVGRRDFPETEGMEAELLLADPKAGDDEEAAQAALEESARRLEARMVGRRIAELMESGFCVSNEEKSPEGEPAVPLRKVRYADIVILLRGLKGWAEDYAEVLLDMGIPARVESSTGYFAAPEVRVLLSFLQILDNPLQDIPMAAVLKSPIGGFSDEELAEIRTAFPKDSFCEAVWALMRPEEAEAKGEEDTEAAGADRPEAGEACSHGLSDEELAGRLRAFGELYRQLRSQVRDTPISRLIRLILRKTGYGSYVAAMPAGQRRAGNLDMLVSKAAAYEKTSYKGLFHFVRYIERLRKYEVDYGEAEVSGENENVVRIMTIHKSKGLEFPVVFVSGCGKSFNELELRQRLVLHPELGLGLLQVGGSPRVWKKTLAHTAIADTLRLENISEEMRILYVAMTRAKEKLILTGVLPDSQKALSKYTGQVQKGRPISYVQRSKASCYLDWILPALMSYPLRYTWKIWGTKELAAGELKDLAQRRLGRGELLRRIEEAPDRGDFFRKAFSYRYPYREQIGRKSKYSVSELKSASMLEQYDRQQTKDRASFLGEEERQPQVPDFILDADRGGEKAARDGQSGASRGAMRGIAVHRVMECLDFGAIPGLRREDSGAVLDFVKGQLEGMLGRGEITEEMAELVEPRMICPFVRSSVAEQMGLACQRGELYREQPFVMEYEEVLVQGIIDVFWQEGERIFVLDYKTDHVREEKELVMRYQKQLQLYEEALLRYFGREGQEAKKLIFAFGQGRVVEL